MKKIKICVLHPSCRNVDDFIRYSKLFELKEKYDFVWDDDEVDVLIASEHIYTNRQFKEKLSYMYKRSKVKLFYGGEAVSPDFNVFDYAVGFDASFADNDRYTQILPPLDFFNKFLPVRSNDIRSLEQAQGCLDEKSKFCNFLYSNANAHPNRDLLFHLVSKYKRVDSLGRHLNNVGTKGTGYLGHALDCIGIKSSYKFSIASENAQYRGYTSEKIFTSLAAHTIPVYWGDPDVTKIVNPRSFINCFDYEKFDDVVEKIREIDRDDAIWCQMVAEPWQTNEQVEYCANRKLRYINFFDRIFSSDWDDIQRLPSGTFPNNYLRYFFNQKLPIYQRVRRSLGRFKNKLIARHG